MSRADKVREAERRVLEASAALRAHKPPSGDSARWADEDMDLWDAWNSAVDEWQRLVAETCPKCGGTGERP